MVNISLNPGPHLHFIHRPTYKAPALPLRLREDGLHCATREPGHVLLGPLNILQCKSFCIAYSSILSVCYSSFITSHKLLERRDCLVFPLNSHHGAQCCAHSTHPVHICGEVGTQVFKTREKMPAFVPSREICALVGEKFMSVDLLSECVACSCAVYRWWRWLQSRGGVCAWMSVHVYVDFLFE